MLVVLLFVLVTSDVCTYKTGFGDYSCTYNGATCADRSCPICNDVQVANDVTNNMLSLNNTLTTGHVTSDNKSAVQYVFSLIKRDIQYAQDSYSWSYDIDQGGVCYHGLFDRCTYKGWTCYEQNCKICKQKKICTYVNSDLKTINYTLNAQYFYSNDSTVVNKVNMQINNMINYCNAYSSANQTDFWWMLLVSLIALALFISWV